MRSATTSEGCPETSSSSTSTSTSTSSRSVSNSDQAARGRTSTTVPMLREESASRRGVSRKTTPSKLPVRSEITRCHVTGFVNFVEAHPSVGRFGAEVEPDQEAQLPSPSAPRHITAGYPTLTKVSETVAPTMAPDCSYGVFKPAASGATDAVDFALPPPRSRG